MPVTVIKVNDVDLTSRVIFKGANFNSRVNGQPGPCQFQVRDDNNDLAFEVGQSITVDIDSQRVWAGYVMEIAATYILAVEPLPVTARAWAITGVDLNILFRRRWTLDPDDPTQMAGKTYKYTGTPTPDTTAITDLVTDFLDLSTDDLDVTTFVENVADINVDQDVNAFAAGWTWEQAMASIAMLPAAIYYIDPERNFVYTDVDTVDAPFAISDTPDGSSSFGYRDAELLKDASNLVNEYLAWGIGTGSNLPVFSRLEDAASVSEHGRWQGASVTYDVYTQDTVDRIADSWVNGSPTSQRGHKDDKIAFICTVFEPGLRGGMKVDVTSSVFGFNDVMPIRELRLSWLTKDNPAFRLTLSHEIDAPWSFYEMFNPAMPKFAWDDLFVVTTPRGTTIVAVGESGKLATSSDGINWTQQTSGFGTSAINAAVYSESLDRFVVGGAATKLATASGDGVTWTLRTSSFSGSENIRGLAWSPSLGLFVAVGDANKIASSPDGINWTQRTSPLTPFLFGDRTIRAVTWSPALGLFLAVAAVDVNGDWIITSDDGIAWIIQDAGYVGTGSYNAAAWAAEHDIGNPSFLIGSNAGLGAVSEDAVTWSIVTSQFGSTTILGALAGARLSMFVGNAGKASYSVDGTVFNLFDASFGTTPIHAGAWSSNLQIFIFVGNDGKLATALDDLDFTQRTSSFGTTNILGVAVADDTGNDGGVGKTDGTDTFDLGSPFWIGTSRVWLDGDAQKLGDDYTEVPDDGLIVFNTTPAANLDVVVTRVIRTPLGGGPSRRIT